MTSKVTCPQCKTVTTAYYCECGKDLRSLFPDAVPKPRPQPPSQLRKTIEEFLSEIGMQDYLETFAKNDVTLEMLKDLTDEDLRSVGIESLGHRKKILDATAKRKSPAATPPASAHLYHSAP